MIMTTLNTKTCTKCGAEKPLCDFRVEKRFAAGYTAECRVCLNARRKAHTLIKIDDVVTRCNKGIIKRAYTNSNACWLSDRSRHEPIAHMLDDLGFVKPEFKGTYEGLFRLPTADRDDRYLAEQMVLVEREAARQIKAEKKRLFTLAKKAERDAGVNPLDIGTTIEEILYQRVRTRIKKYCRKYGVSVSADFSGLRGRTMSQYFEQQFGYTSEQLIAHIESLFTVGMDWRSLAAGSIHLDHKSPMAIFDVRDAQQLRMCFQLGNLQPLHPADNMLKSGVCDLTGENVRTKF